MSEAPKTFHAQDNSQVKSLRTIILLMACIIMALVFYIWGRPAPQPAAATPSTPAPAAPPAPAAAAIPPPDTNAPLSFRFDYLDKPNLWREWRRVNATHWEEREPDGRLTHFTVLSRHKDAERVGTIVRREPDQKMDVFIPDKKSSRRMYWRHAPAGEWVYMGQVSAEAPLPDGNEF